MADFPKIPTLNELGYDFTFTDTFMLSAPKGVPADVRAKLYGAIETGHHGSRSAEGPA